MAGAGGPCLSDTSPAGREISADSIWLGAGLFEGQALGIVPYHPTCAESWAWRNETTVVEASPHRFRSHPSRGTFEWHVFESFSRSSSAKLLLHLLADS